MYSAITQAWYHFQKYERCTISVKKKMQGNVAVLQLSGELMGESDIELVHNTVKELIQQGTKQIVIDTSKIVWINSIGLGMLTAGFSSLANAGGALKLAKLLTRSRAC